MAPARPRSRLSLGAATCPAVTSCCLTMTVTLTAQGAASLHQLWLALSKRANCGGVTGAGVAAGSGQACVGSVRSGCRSRVAQRSPAGCCPRSSMLDSFTTSRHIVRSSLQRTEARSGTTASVCLLKGAPATALSRKLCGNRAVPKRTAGSPDAVFQGSNRLAQRMPWSEQQSGIGVSRLYEACPVQSQSDGQHCGNEPRACWKGGCRHLRP